MKKMILALMTLALAGASVRTASAWGFVASVVVGPQPVYGCAPVYSAYAAPVYGCAPSYRYCPPPRVAYVPPPPAVVYRPPVVVAPPVVVVPPVVSFRFGFGLFGHHDHHFHHGRW